jgi:hypothetical protein
MLSCCLPIVWCACASCLQHFPSILHQLDNSLPKGDIDVKMIDFGTAQLCKDGCSVAEGISGTPGAPQELGCMMCWGCTWLCWPPASPESVSTRLFV